MSTTPQNTEKDFVFNGRKDWKKFYKKTYLKENLEIEDESLKKGFTPDDISKKHNIPIEQVQQDLEDGAKHEMEHVTDPNEARIIASQHLWENPDWYQRAKVAGLEEEKKRSFIRPNWEAGATPPESAKGPGIVSPTSTATGPAPGTVAAPAAGGMTEKLNLSGWEPRATLPNKPRNLLAKKDIQTKAEEFLRKGETGGLEAMTLDGHNYLLDHIQDLTPEQQQRFNNMNAMLESKKKVVKVKQGSPRNDGSATTKPSRQLHKKKTEYDRTDKAWQRLDESENRAKYFKDAWRNFKK